MFVPPFCVCVCVFVNVSDTIDVWDRWRLYCLFVPLVTIGPVALSGRGKSDCNKVHTASEDMSITSCPAYFRS